MARVPKKHPILTHKAPVVQIYSKAEAADDAYDAKKGIKDGSPQDLAIDKKRGLPAD